MANLNTQKADAAATQDPEGSSFNPLIGNTQIPLQNPMISDDFLPADQDTPYHTVSSTSGAVGYMDYDCWTQSEDHWSTLPAFQDDVTSSRFPAALLPVSHSGEL